MGTYFPLPNEMQYTAWMKLKIKKRKQCNTTTIIILSAPPLFWLYSTVVWGFLCSQQHPYEECSLEVGCFFFFLFFFWDTYRQRPFVSVKANFHKNWALSLPTSNAGGRSGLFFLPVPTIYFLQQLLAKGMDLKKFLHGADSMHSEILCHFKLQGLAMISFRLSVRTFVCV